MKNKDKIDSQLNQLRNCAFFKLQHRLERE